jgi:DNA-binding GntR family transcriptional regulator
VSSITPVERRPGDHAANAVHAHLRQLILDGVLPAGQAINQVTLASELGVSRTPVREAIRMLQEEGLVDAQPQKRARIAGFDPQHLETVYTQRVLLESVAAAVTAANTTEDQLNRLEDTLQLLDRPPEERLDRTWRRHHTSFHLVLVSGVHPTLQQAIRTNMDRGEHYRLNYRLMYQQTGTRSWDTSPQEHRAIVDAFHAHDGRTAAYELANHLARTALALIAQLTPTYDPTALRTAVELATHR